MKKFKCLLFLLFVFVLGARIKYAEQINATVTITGKNYAGKILSADVECPVEHCTESYQWYYNNTNSTSGGIAISGEEVGAYKISRELKGKYIYVVVTLSADGYEDTTISDITDKNNNSSAVVIDYLEYDSESEYTVDMNVDYGDLKLDFFVENIQNDTNTSYYVYFGNNNSVPTIDVSKSDCVINSTNDVGGFHSTMNTTDGLLVSGNDGWYVVNGYSTLFIIKRFSVDGNRYCSIATKPIVMEKPSLTSLGTRYSIFFMKDSKELSLFPNFPYDLLRSTYDFKVKIGLIDSDTFFDDYSKGLEDNVLTYVKSANGKTYSYRIDNNVSNKVDYGDLNLKEGNYYYIYTSLDTKDGLLRGIDDVVVSYYDGGNLISYVDFEKNSDYEYTDYEEVNNPDTGLTNLTITLLAIVLFGTIAYFVIKKKSKFPQA